MLLRWFVMLIILVSLSPTQAGKEDWWWALRDGDLATIEAELAKGRNPNKAKDREILPLTLTSAAGHLEAVKILMKHGAEPFPKTKRVLPIRAAIEERRWPVVRHLLNGPKGVNVQDYLGRTALTHAVIADRNSVLRQLLEAGVDPNIADRRGQTPLLYAVEWGRSNHAMLLLQYGADVNHKNQQDTGVLDYLALSRDEELLTFLKAPNGWRTQPEAMLMAAVAKGDTDKVVTLLDAGADLNVLQSFSRDSLVHMAVKHRHDGILNILLDRKAKPDLMNEDGLTPLMIAVAFGREDMVKRLMKHGANVNRSGLNHWSVVAYAALQDGMPMLPLLEQWGAMSIRRNTGIFGRIKRMKDPFIRAKTPLKPMVMGRLDADELKARIDQVPGAWDRLRVATGPYTFVPQPLEEWVVGVDVKTVEKIVLPVFTHKEPPVYPEGALRSQQGGAVILRAVLRKDGRMSNIQVVEGFKGGWYGFETAAMLSLHGWQFTPARLDDRPISVRMTLKIDFTMN